MKGKKETEKLAEEMPRRKESDFEMIQLEGIIRVRNENQAKTGQN